MARTDDVITMPLPPLVKVQYCMLEIGSGMLEVSVPIAQMVPYWMSNYCARNDAPLTLGDWSRPPGASSIHVP